MKAAVGYVSFGYFFYIVPQKWKLFLMENLFIFPFCLDFPPPSGLGNFVGHGLYNNLIITNWPCFNARLPHACSYLG